MNLQETIEFCKQEIIIKAQHLEFLESDIIAVKLDQDNYAVFLKQFYTTDENGEWIPSQLVWMEYPANLVKLDKRNNPRFFIPRIQMRATQLVYLIDIKAEKVTCG
jgi:hypothetical protein